MGKRAWGQWGKRFKQEIDATSSLAGFAGGATAATGLVLAAPIVASIGAVVVAGTAAWCAVRSFPPLLKSPQDMVGKRFENLAELENIYPRIPRIGVIGVGQSGKSTLVSHLGWSKETDERTDRLYFSVIGLPGDRGYFALIDGAGQQFAQQFKAAELSDMLIVFLDHDETSTGRRSTPERLRQHEMLIDQTANHLKVEGKHPAFSHILLNKRDLWENARPKPQLGEWLEEQVAEWKNRVGGNVTFGAHSNRISSDITKISEVIRSWLS